jgi:leader peptidase (prepilin peptidase)/N-methyltransferase
VGPWPPATLAAPPLWSVVVLAALGGLAIGSFLNVVAYRAPRHLSVLRPPSFCPGCQAPVRALDNVPLLSWLLLRGRCRSCRSPIPVRYPVVEASTAALFALVAWAVGAHWAVIGLCLLAAGVLASVVVETDRQSPAPAVAEVATGLGLLGLIAAATPEHHWAHLVGAMAGTLRAALVAPVAGRWITSVGAGTGGAAGGALLVPAGAVLGWSGPVGAACGLGVLGGALVVRARPRLVREGRAGGPPRRFGPAAAAALSCVVAVACALAAGTSLA